MENDMKICTMCKIGKDDYELDKTSTFCTYINCLKDGKCSEFENIEES